jgi:hypothetical protein
MRYLTTLAVAAVALIGCDQHTSTAPSDVVLPQQTGETIDPLGPAPDGSTTAPVSLGVDVTQLLPAPVELPTPMLCGALTVYDEEDAATLCSSTTLAAVPITSPTCPRPVSGSVRLETDLICLNSDGLIVTSDNTVIDLNGHRIVCTEPGGYGGSCQSPDGDFEFGIETNGHDNVHIFSHVPGGTIDGFDRGIVVRQQSDNVKIKQVTITGPAIGQGPRPVVFGIELLRVDCAGGPVRIGGGSSTGNDISHHTQAIRLLNSACVYIGYNRLHDNQTYGGPFISLPILLSQSPDNHIRGNVVTRNGDGLVRDAGLFMQGQATTNVLVVENQFNENNGNGIRIESGAGGNYIVNNQMLFNTRFDASSDQTSVNQWNPNNRCITQTTPEPPPGTCGRDETPPPQ